MDRKIAVRQSHGKAAPWAIVPSKYRWDLVEYLAYQRTQVQYTYGATQFYIRFLRLDQPAAQQMLDRWADSDATQPDYAQHHQTHEALMASP